MTGAQALSSAGFDDCGVVGRLDIGGWYCSGVLVHPRVLLTVAHCGPSGGRAVPRAAAVRISDLAESADAEIVAGRFIAHEGFTRRGQPFDIAAMMLRRAVKVKPVPLATTKEIATAGEVTLAGFGSECEEAGPSLRFRRALTVPIHFFAGGPRNALPEGVAPGPPCLNPPRFNPAVEFLAGADEAGPCFGDSGGPAYIYVQGRRKLAGIISRPVARRKPFCKGLMILTRVDAFRPWIKSIRQAAG